MNRTAPAPLNAEASGPDACRTRVGARLYDAAERRWDASIHLSALGAAALAVPALVVLVFLWRGDLPALAGTAIYGMTLIAMLLCSFLYNHWHPPHRKDLFRRIDMTAIFLKIAGTVTPFALLTGTGKLMLAAIWGSALAAIAAVFLLRRHPTFLSVGIGLAMGWGVLVTGRDVLAEMSWLVIGLMLAGGLLYSLGTPFLLAERMRFHNAIWHGFVVVASGVYFAAVVVHAAQTGAVMQASAGV